MLEQDTFVRAHGLGNDYLVVDARRLSFSLTPGVIQRLCNRHVGIGSDGVLVYEPPQGAETARLRIFNPDGSEAEKSGNGLRIFCKFLHDWGYTRDAHFTVWTSGGTVEAKLFRKGDRIQEVALAMGQAVFDAEKIPAEGFEGEIVQAPLEVAGNGEKKIFSITCVNIGNPHCVVFTHRPDQPDIHVWGPLLEKHPAFPRRINVQFAFVEDDANIDIRIWERGAGYTLASGSSSCAVAAAAVKTGKAKSPLTLHMPGGDLFVEVSPSFELKMKGPVEEICSGRFSKDFLHTLKTLGQGV